MAIRYEQFVHPKDVAAMRALDNIPGFKKLAKEFLYIWHEKQYFIKNMSSNIKLGPNQMPEIYELLPPICEKLGIDVPELYVKLDRDVNAFTLGDTDIAIVLTSGLIETLSKEEIQIIIAHECGHILCHHTLYKTMINLIIETSNFIIGENISKMISAPILVALRYWNRCSEFSADRVSAYFAGSSELVSDVMMRLAGGTQNLKVTLNKEEFIKQAANYKAFIDTGSVNKGLEIFMYVYETHPLLAYRAFEVTSWCNSEEFYNIDPKIIVDVPDDSDKLDIEQFIVDTVNASHISAWFKENNPHNQYTNIAIHCGICKKNFSYLKRLSFNSSKTIYQACVDSKNNVIKYRLILFSSVDKGLKDLFVKNEGYILVR